MIGNNSCGSTAQAYGKMVDNVRRLEVLTYDGTRMWVGPHRRRRVRRRSSPAGTAAPRSTAACATSRDDYLARHPHPLPRHPAPGLRLQPRLAAARERTSTSPGPWSAARARWSRCCTPSWTWCAVPRRTALVVLGYADIVAGGRRRAARPAAPAAAARGHGPAADPARAAAGTWPARRCAELPGGRRLADGAVRRRQPGRGRREGARRCSTTLEGTRARRRT